MDTATPRPQSTFKAAMPRKKGPPTALRIDTPAQNLNIALEFSDPSAPTSTLSSATSDSDSFVFPPPTKSRSRNMKKLSLTLPSAQSSTTSLVIPEAIVPPSPAQLPATVHRRRPSVLSLPNASTGTLLHRKDEDGDGSPSAPYLDGPIQILPGIWLGSEDNARDWKGLIERGIKSVLNVAKEVVTVFDNSTAQPLRPFMSTPDLSVTVSTSDSTYYPAHIPSGRPAMHYLKLPWSHGQSDLVRQGFPAAMLFVDQALERGDGVLIHCQCGVSRSATMVIALVMRAAAQCSPSVPPEVWALKGMQGAYSFVKQKSKWVGPNILIYQLLDYERSFKPGNASPAASERSSVAMEEEEWGRQRQMLEDADDADQESLEIIREARALDKAMEDRLVARKSSTSSISSTGRGMGQAWRNRYGHRKRAGSIASTLTTGSVLSEDLVEEDEEQELLGVGGGFISSTEPTEDETSSLSSADPNSRQTSPCHLGDERRDSLPAPRMPPSAPAHKNTFLLPPVPATAIRSTFEFPSRLQPKVKARRRPPPLVGILPPVPSSPVTPIVPATAIPARSRVESRKPEQPPAYLRRPPSSRSSSNSSSNHPLSATPSQTLFVFPPSPTRATMHTPSTMTLTSNSSFVFPALSTPRISTFRSQGRSKSFIGVPSVSTPTVASSRVDARGWVGIH
ncbi:unnamed protein product [Somion occarium]|uniref:protein-tyrosine-phosphatase n=1 Tax=Somion occarium TaxID=3059160 RepID=A0ABP1CN45_9APHY